jgi:calcineurin-like phosphoesterase family protein
MMLKSPNSARFVLFHYPIASWNGMSDGVIHLHGHVHFNPEEKLGPGKMMDVGFDGSEEFRPYSLNEILNLMKNRPTTSLLKGDHHV